MRRVWHVQVWNRGQAIGFFILLCCLSTAQAQRSLDAAPSAYRFGVFPYLPPVRVAELYASAAADFAAALQRDVQLRTKKTFEGWYDEVKKQSYDIVWIQPFDYIHAFEKYGYRPLARDREPLSAVLMVRADSALQSLAELGGQPVALPPARAAVSHLVNLTLLKAGLVPGQSVTVRYFINHDSCLQHVLIGTAAACGTTRAFVRNFASRHAVSLRELAVTPAIPHVLFAVHERVPTHERESLLQVILGWQMTDKGRHFLASTGRQFFVKAEDADYHIVRAYAKRLQLTE